MEHAFNNGAIIVKSDFYQEAIYHVSNNKISVIFDGKGGIKSYAKVNETHYMKRCSSAVHKNGQHIDIRSKKTVIMQGRRQIIQVETDAGDLTIEQLLDKNTDGIYLYCSLENAKSDDVIQYSVFLTNVMTNVSVFTDGQAKTFLENAQLMVTLSKSQPKTSALVTFDKREINDLTTDFERVKNDCEREIQSVIFPENLTETQKALYHSSYFCALENYKEVGDFKGFTAGHRYISPLRTYYRDSYYTILPMYNGHVDKVKNQITTLAMGVANDGTCPSAVKVDFSAYWGNHYDSPSFFVIMLYDYVRFTGEKEFLKQIVNGFTVLEIAQKVIEKLAEYAVNNGLLYKQGAFNKRDWADEVNRYGFVTYDEVLYARALYSLSKMFSIENDKSNANKYMDEFTRVKDAINSQLWDDNKGYYVNFKNEDYVEDNLSVDTVWAVIFGIADSDRAKRLLKNMENILETKNNPYLKDNDFGVACVYPPYKNNDSAYWKSAQPFNYHNGANWPYWSATYAYAKKQYGMQFSYPLEKHFTYNTAKGNYTPIEYFSPYCDDGSLLQAWGAMSAFVLDEKLSKDFYKD